MLKLYICIRIIKKARTMNVITINEFNTNQNHFLEMAKKGMDLKIGRAHV